MLNNKNHIIFLSLGSNLGDKQKNIEKAYEKIEERIGNIVSQSLFFISEPQGFKSENIFVNSVCEVHTELKLNSIFAIIQLIEKELGRVKKSQNLKYTDRIIDIDLILVDDMVINTPDLIIPHPRYHLRDFVLAPLCEIAPDIIHPILGKTNRELLEDLTIKKTAQI